MAGIRADDMIEIHETPKTYCRYSRDAHYLAVTILTGRPMQHEGDGIQDDG